MYCIMSCCPHFSLETNRYGTEVNSASSIHIYHFSKGCSREDEDQYKFIFFLVMENIWTIQLSGTKMTSGGIMLVFLPATLTIPGMCKPTDFCMPWQVFWRDQSCLHCGEGRMIHLAEKQFSLNRPYPLYLLKFGCVCLVFILELTTFGKMKAV